MMTTEGNRIDFDGRDPLCDLLMADGEVRRRCLASAADWMRVVAFSSEALPNGAFCDECGLDSDVGELAANHGCCDSCIDFFGEWDYEATA
jgi:hypothetical protein